MRSKADETLVIVETLICPLQISFYHYYLNLQNVIFIRLCGMKLWKIFFMRFRIQTVLLFTYIRWRRTLDIAGGADLLTFSKTVKANILKFSMRRDKEVSHFF